ncbi:hypothetical protein PF008_g25373 [Phytophthora fragariae]|uniref:Uncharacterized protein n=1 Tax=Phytophthora fragariae TaxID=53985 RepID=A0A6G0QK40_9STRA|nr:hypothetical protein PF008_g25373 [Phytophthora fragariae]
MDRTQEKILEPVTGHSPSGSNLRDLAAVGLAHEMCDHGVFPSLEVVWVPIELKAREGYLAEGRGLEGRRTR